MKKFQLFFTVTLLLFFCLSACSSAQTDEDAAQTETEEVMQQDVLDRDQSEPEPTEDPQIAADSEQALEYLSILGLDDTCSYQINDTFPSGIDGKKMFLLTVQNITEEDFKGIENALQSNGFLIVSDINVNEEIKTKSYPYSDNESLYIEIVFSYGAQYFDVSFTPTS